MKKKKNRATPTGEGDYKKENRKFDAAIARWTKVVGISTVVLAIATIISSYFLWVTDETLRHTLEVNQRPWVHADVVIAGPLTFDETGSYLPLKITLKNSGLALAHDVRVFPVMYAEKIAPITNEEIRETRCRKPRNDSSHGTIGFTLFPSQTSTEILAPGLSKQDVASIKEKIINKTRIFLPTIVVCVSYISTVGKGFHFSTSLFALGGHDPSRPNAIGVIDLSAAPVPPERLYLWPLGSFAD